MIDLGRTLVEGVTQVAMPCAMGLLGPGLAVLLMAGRRHLLAIGTFTIAAGLAAWQRAVNPVEDWSHLILTVLALASVALFLLAREHWWALTTGGAGLGAVAGATWIPCVGEQLGGILINAPASPIAELAPMLIYVIGVCIGLIALALVPTAFPKTRSRFEHRMVLAVGSLAAIGLVAAVAADIYPDLLLELPHFSVR